MAVIEFFVNLLRDPRTFIASWIVALGPVWVYSPLFLIIFIETGLVFFPFLPGDSLLFAVGVFSAPGGGLHLAASLLVFYAAAILGNTSNYWIARFFGKHIIDSGKVKALTPERMAKLDHFFAKYGGLTIVITRFMPFFRTFAPFIAGTGHMNFGKFTLYNSIGGVAWVSLFVLVGYFFGGVPFVQQHFEVIVLGIVAVSVAPALVGAVKGALSGRKKGAVKGAEGVTGGAHAQVTPSASRIPAQNSEAPLGFASGTSEAQEFTPTDPLGPSETEESAAETDAQVTPSAFDEGATGDAAEKFVDGEAN